MDAPEYMSILVFANVDTQQLQINQDIHYDTGIISAIILCNRNNNTRHLVTFMDVLCATVARTRSIRIFFIVFYGNCWYKFKRWEETMERDNEETIALILFYKMWFNNISIMLLAGTVCWLYYSPKAQIWIQQLKVRSDIDNYFDNGFFAAPKDVSIRIIKRFFLLLHCK